jgi:capsular polysaccharide transport system permease protein
MRSQKLDPGAPGILALRSQIEATKHQLAIVERNVGQNPEGSNLSGVVGEFEQLDLERQLAQTMLTGAQQAYDQARAVAAAQALYVVPFVRPYLPESATYPRRWLNLSLVAIISLVIWTFLLLVVRSLGDHYA